MKRPSRTHEAPGRTLLPAALLAASCLGVAGFVLSGAALAQDGGTPPPAAKPADAKGQDAKKDEGAKPATQAPGRGRLTGQKTPPKPSTVPVSKPAAAPPKADPGVPEKPIFGPDMSPEEAKKAEAAYEEKLRAAQAAAKGAAVPRPPRNPNAKLGIEFGTETHDFGRARQGDQLTHVFEMKSAGSEPLIITQASPTCGCTLGEVKVKESADAEPVLYKFGDPIAPGADVLLSATLDTGSKRNDTQVRIQVYSNDGSVNTTTLTLKASIQPFIVATPPYLQLGNVRQGEEKTARITFRTSGGEKVLLSRDTTRVVPVPDGLEVDVAAVNPDEEGKSNQWTATFTVRPDAPEGASGFMLRLNSDVELPQGAHAQDPKVAEALEAKADALGKKPGTPTVYTCDANISYNIIGALSMTPQYISLGLVRPGQAVVRSARLTAHEDGFDLSGVKVSLTGEGDQELLWADRFVASVKPVSGSNAVDIELRLEGLPEEADGAFRGRVLIETGHPAKPELFLRFSGVCRKLAAGGPQRPDPVQKGPVQQPVGKGAPGGQ